MLAADPVQEVLGRAAETMSRLPGQVEQGFSHARELSEKLTAFMHGADKWTHLGLLPLGLALLVLHEQSRTITEGGIFRTGHVVGRAIIVVGLLSVYPRLCSLIMGIAGSGGAWMSLGQYATLTDLDRTVGLLGDVWDKHGLRDLIMIAIVWAMLMVAVLFSYIAGTLLSFSQAAIISILLALGKTCITLSLVPGISLGKSWARVLAQVAAWSTVGGVLTILLKGDTSSVERVIREGKMAPMLALAAHSVLVALGTLSVPMITQWLFAGMASHAIGVATAIAGGAIAAKASLGGLKRIGIGLTPSGRPGGVAARAWLSFDMPGPRGNGAKRSGSSRSSGRRKTGTTPSDEGPTMPQVPERKVVPRGER